MCLGDPSAGSRDVGALRASQSRRWLGRSAEHSTSECEGGGQRQRRPLAGLSVPIVMLVEAIQGDVRDVPLLFAAPVYYVVLKYV